ncbi:MAG TPA: erythromycin esterase family protein, partial [Thermomicrobiales bacterium]|nr:erythromycin esterase family protein [Thermomicrobiales bacterium]
FTLEASHTACEPVNEFVQGGEGDVEALLSGIHYLAWYTEEFVALVEWLRDWNSNAPGDRKVTFLGVDVTYNERGREAVLAYFNRVALEKASDAERIFAVLADGESKWPLRIDEATRAAIDGILPELDALVAWLDDHRARLVSRSSAREFDRIRFALTLMSPYWIDGPVSRTRSIGENLTHLLDRDHPGEKAVFWAHNGHVDAGTDPDGKPKAGHILRKRFGDGYYACSLEFGEGSFQYRQPEPDGTLSDLTTDTIDPPQDGTIPWHLKRTGAGNTLIDLRPPSGDPAVREWLDTPQPVHALGWAHPTPPSATGAFADVTPGSSFDGILFVERSTPVHPTATALEHAARKERF